MAAEFKIIASAETDKAAADINKFAGKAEKDIRGVASISEALAKVLKAVEANTSSTAGAIDKLGTSLKSVPKTPPLDPKPVQEFTGTIGVLVGRLPKLRQALLNATDPKQIERLNKIIGETQVRIAGLTQRASAGAAAINTVQNSSNRASFAVLNLGRIAQDSAFGFIGIANNIEPFVQSLTALKRESGSTKTAVKSFFSSLAGPGAIGLIIGAISLLDSYSKGYGVFAGRLKDAKEKTDKLAEAIESINTGVAEERTRLLALTKAASDNTISTENRLNAIGALRDEFGPYFQDLTNEQILNGDVAGAVDLATAAILRKAQAASKEKQLTIEFENQEKKAQELLNTQAKLAQKIEQRRKVQEQLNQASDAQTRSGLSRFIQDLTGDIGDLTALERELFFDTLQADLVVNTLAASVAKLGPTIKDNNDTVRAASRATQSFNEDKKETLKLQAREIQGLLALTTLGERLIEQRKISQKVDIRQVPGETGVISTAGRGAPKAVTDALKAFDEKGKKNIDEFNNKISLIGQNLTGVFSGAFQAISEGQSPIEAISQSLKGLIVRLASAAAAAALLSALLPGGQAAAAGGFGGIFKGLLGLASGGIATRPTPALVGDGGPEAVIPLSQLANIIGGVAMQMGGGSGGGTPLIRGQDIHYINNAASNSFSRLFR